MKVLHTIPSLGVNSGGPPLSTTLTVRGVREHNIDVQILTYDISDKSDKNISEKPYIHFLPPPVERIFSYSKEFSNFLKNNSFDLYHCQGIWQYPSYITSKIALKFNKPYIITPRGMLYPQELNKSRFKKKAALNLYQFEFLQKAASIHATCKEEMVHLKDLGISSPIAVIPNPIETSEYFKKEVTVKKEKKIGYLGRIHPRKRIERLLYSWHELGNSTDNSELIIIGAGDDKYHDFLKIESKRLELENVRFTGFLSGNEKEKVLDDISFLVVPSDFENFGMIIAEALIRGIPVIASKGTPWQDLEEFNCGWWIENDIESITDAIDDAFKLTDQTWLNMAKRGKSLIKEKYTVDIVGKKMSELYYWILNDKNKPSFVHT